MRSNSRAPREMMSTCPLVRGSNVPGSYQPPGRPACVIRRGRSPRVLEHRDAAGNQHVGHSREIRLRSAFVRRIEQHYIEYWRVERRRGRARIRERASHICADDSIAVRDAAVREVFRDQRTRAPIAFDERHVRRASAERLDSAGTRPRIAVEHARPSHARRENVEQRLAQLVGGRPQSLPRGRFQPAAFQRAGYDAHENRVIGLLGNLVIELRD